ncbi:iron-sulfur cluster assembly accessory protein [Photobacterium kasasachensis]|uniref:iron-sulfur cluster assembly accessory protein n=1 Tax=Photobacterium kasasachensis TaxID=2910240 RepID=UPI003D128416
MDQEKQAVQAFDVDGETWQGVRLTQAAAKQVSELMRANQVCGLRLSVRPSGCVGFAYQLELVASVNDTDLIYRHGDGCLYVDKEAMPFVDGTEIDYVREGINHSFKYNNPRVKVACGCGESFSV